MDIIKISIPNWAKFNPRSDRANYSWFRFQNDFFHDQKIFGMTDSQIILFQMLICELSKKNKNEIEINVEYFATFRKTTIAMIKEDLRALLLRGLIETADSRLNDGEEPALLPATNVRTYERNETNERTNIALAPQAPGPYPVPIYCEVYKEKYGHNPVIGKKQAGILTRFAKSHPKNWEKILRGYLQMPDSWAVARSHPVELLENKINEIVRFLETGKVVTKKVVEHAEELIDKAQGTSRKPRKSIDEMAAERAQMMAEANVVSLTGRGEK